MYRRRDFTALEQSAPGKHIAGGVHSYRRRLQPDRSPHPLCHCRNRTPAFAIPHDKHFHISINVAARHFAEGELLRDLHKLWFSAYPVQQLVVELTERDVLQDGDHHMAEHLHFRGVPAIDDFGTGNSSLSGWKSYGLTC